MYQLKKIAAMLCVSGLAMVAKAQFTNGNFQLPGISSCGAGTGWATGTGSQMPEYFNIGSNFLVDITDCGSFGNGAWLQQYATTVPGRFYYIQLDLGTWVGWQQWDAGVNIDINGVPLNSGATRVSHNNYGSNPEWRTLRSCVFKATGTSTLVRFTGNGANPLNPAYSQPAPGPGVIALDNVVLVPVIEGILGTAETGCNKYCFSIKDSFTNSAAVFSGIQWYVNGNAEGSDSIFCRKFPNGSSNEIMVVYSITDACGTVRDTVKTIVEADDDCPCEFAANISLSYDFIPCNTYNFNLDVAGGYEAAFTKWTVDGVLFAGSLTSATLSNLSPGTHTICANAMGNFIEEPGNLCCGKVCIDIVVPEKSTDPNAVVRDSIITYCELLPPGTLHYNPCIDCPGYYEFYRDGIMTGNSNDNGCIDYVLAGVCEMRCYEILPGGVKCLKKTIRFILAPQPAAIIQDPDINIVLCEKNETVFTPPCAAPYTRYEISGPGYYNAGSLVPSAPDLLLTTGTYVLKCYDEINCIVKIANVVITRKDMQITSCQVIAESCEQLLDEKFLENALKRCPECRNVVMNASYAGPWKQISYDPLSMVRVVVREYVDSANCRKCIVTFKLQNQAVLITEIDMSGRPCITLYEEDLLPCLRGKLWVFLDGYPSEAVSADAKDGIKLCCNNRHGVQDPVYWIYSEEDPCCFMLVRLKCKDEIPGMMQPKQDESKKEAVLKTNANLKLAPNPASSVFRVVSDKTFEQYLEITVIDMNGRTVLSVPAPDSETLVDVRSLSEGTYTVKVNMPAGEVVSLMLSLSKN